MLSYVSTAVMSPSPSSPPRPTCRRPSAASLAEGLRGRQRGDTNVLEILTAVRETSTLLARSVEACYPIRGQGAVCRRASAKTIGL